MKKIGLLIIFLNLMYGSSFMEQMKRQQMMNGGMNKQMMGKKNPEMMKKMFKDKVKEKEKCIDNANTNKELENCGLKVKLYKKEKYIYKNKKKVRKKIKVVKKCISKSKNMSDIMECKKKLNN